MKRSELIFDAILLPLDFLSLLIAGAAAYYLRVSPYVQRVRPAVFQLDLKFLNYIQLVSVVSLVVITIFAIQGLYTVRVTRRALDELTRIFASVSMGIMGVIVFIFISARSFQSRFIVLAAYIMAIFLVTLSRYIVRQVQLSFLRHGLGIHRVVLVGNGRFGKQLSDIFEERRGMGYRVVGMLNDVQWNDLAAIYKNYGIDDIIQTNPSMSEEDNLVLLDFCDTYKIDYKYIPNLFETYAANVEFRQFGGVPVMELLRTPLDGWGRIAKRVIDITGAVCGLIVLSPILLITAICIKLNSPGPILYYQIRIGRGMQPFKIFKFRSMYLECSTGPAFGGEKAEKMEQDLRKTTNERAGGPLFKMRNDPRITKVGLFIRHWRIDELPQLLNVLKGEMSLLGPRPHLPIEVQRYNKHHRKLFTIKPGMSGMAQVNGSAGLSFEQEAKLDIGYIERWSLWTDVILLVKTFKILIGDKNAV